MDNMFNNMSRKECRRILDEYFPNILPLFDIFYKTHNKVYTCMTDGSFKIFLQMEGFAQGCLMSTVLSVLMPGDVIIKLKNYTTNN
eukprot:7038741-Ditylum_brightwellii.AAC.1